MGSGCGSTSSSSVGGLGTSLPSGVQEQATFNGAVTRSFVGTQGEMEFNISLLEPGDPPRPVTQLSANQISFRVDSVTDLLGIPQPLSVTLTPSQIQNPSPDLAQQPLLMAVLMDGSGSLFVTDRRDQRFVAAFGLLDQFRRMPVDFGAILRFDNRGTGFGSTALGQPLQTAQLLQDFTDDEAQLQRGILQTTPGGNTALYDATLEAARLLSDFRPTETLNRRLVVFTDGIDNDSNRSLEATIQVLTDLSSQRGHRLSTYVVGLGTTLDLIELQQLASATQGTFVLATSPEALVTPFANLFPAAIGEHRLQVQVQSNGFLPNSSYLLSGELQIDRNGVILATPFTNAVLVTGS